MKPRNELANDYHNRLPEGPFQKSFVHGAFVHGYDAGYQAAKDAYKDAIDTYEDVAKQMLEEAVRIMSPKEQLADVGKVMNSPKKLDSWISVKERLPEYDQFVLLWHPDFKRQFVGCRVDSGIIDPLYWWQLELDMHEPDRIITHWMPLPNPPEEK